MDWSALLAAWLGCLVGGAFYRPLRAGSLLAATIGVAIGWQGWEMTVQARAAYSTTYMYGEAPLGNVCLFLERAVPQGSLIIAPKDIGSVLQTKARFIELDEDPTKYFDNPCLQFLVTRESDYYGHCLLDKIEKRQKLEAEFVLIGTVDHFRIYKKRTVAINRACDHRPFEPPG